MPFGVYRFDERLHRASVGQREVGRKEGKLEADRFGHGGLRQRCERHSQKTHYGIDHDVSIPSVIATSQTRNDMVDLVVRVDAWHGDSKRSFMTGEALPALRSIKSSNDLK
jgi:hypothetical protein